jgi:hypothetical protein
MWFFVKNLKVKNTPWGRFMCFVVLFTHFCIAERHVLVRFLQYVQDSYFLIRFYDGEAKKCSRNGDEKAFCG